MTPSRDRLALVVPLKDEAAGLPALAPAFDRLRERLAADYRLEFVLVDDGSADQTWKLLGELFGGRQDVRLVQHSENRGVSAAILSGVRATSASLCASIDGDLSYDPCELEHMLPLLADAEIVTASPYHQGGGVEGVPGWRLLLSRTLSSCYRLLLGSPIATWTSCFRLYRREAIVDLEQRYPGFLGTAELLVRVLRRGGRVREHPCVLGVRRFGASKLKVLRTIVGHLGLLWLVALRRIK